MFGSAGGVFSALYLESLGFDELDLRLEMDLGSRFRIEEVDMVPRNRLSVASVLWLGLMLHWASDREREREFGFKCWLRGKWKMSVLEEEDVDMTVENLGFFLISKLVFKCYEMI
jgi:hypothetical protein